MVTQEQATSYERAVFESVNSLMCENRDDDVAFDLHFKVSLLPRLLCLPCCSRNFRMPFGQSCL